MPGRVSLGLLIALLLSCVSFAKKKNQQEIPDLVLNAQTVLIVIHPDAGEPVTNPIANRTAQENVKDALGKWGRFRVVMSPQIADLVIAVRKGHASGPEIRNSPADDRPVIFEPSSGDIRVDTQKGHPPGLSDPRLGPKDGAAQLSHEIGSSEDSFEVYRGRGEYPLDASPIWRYRGKNALDAPTVAAVARFRKAVDESEKQRQQKP